MIDVLSYLDEREEEFARHLSIARILESRIDELKDDGSAHVEVRHLNTLKSGLLIHLYNIVEAVSTRTLETVGRTVIAEKPERWKETILSEWIRAEIWAGEERIGDGVLTRLTRVSGTLVSGNSPNAFVVKGEPGSWDNKSIEKVAKRLGCSINLPPSVRENALKKQYRNETTSLQFLAKQRNAIAHGNCTFEEGAGGMTFDDLETLSQRILPYLRAVSNSYKSFLDNKEYIKQTKDVA